MTQLNLDLPAEIEPEEATLLLAVKLWEVGRLSSGQAAELAGCSKRNFLEALGKYDVPVFNYPAEDLENEVNG